MSVDGGTGRERAPRILVFSTNNISDPGIDLAGSRHLHYPPTVSTITVPCSSGIRPGWIIHAFERGFDGVFIASDGEECAYLPDCSARSARIAAEAQELLRLAVGQPHPPALAGGGDDDPGLRGLLVLHVRLLPFSPSAERRSRG